MTANVFQVKRGSTAAVNAYTPALGELVLDTTLMQLRIGDGVTSGGTFAANAPTATKLLNARDISTTGAVSGTVSFDGSANVSMVTTLASSIALLGTPTTTTAAPGTNSTQIATTAFVAALGALKADLASPTFTGVPAAPTAAPGVSTTQLATTAFVTTADNLKANLASPTFTGVPAVPTAAPGTNTTQAASTAFVAALGALKLDAANPTSTGLLTLNGGQIKFPAAQSPSADANTLDDYEEGTWTPVVTFATPGNLAITYSNQFGFYTKIGREVTLRFTISTSAFTHTTASGALQITGLPFANSATTGSGSRGTLDFGGITKASYTHYVTSIGASASLLGVACSGSGQAPSALVAADTPTGGTLVLSGSITYMT